MSLQDAIAAIREALEQYLGPARARSISDGEIVRVHLGGGRNFQPANVDAAIQGIMSSPEAEAYFKSQQNAPPAGTTPPGTTSPPPGTTTTPPVTGPGPTTDPFQTRPTPGQMPDHGYDRKNWGTMNSMKYRASEILARYPATPAGLKQAFNDPDFKATFPNAKLVGKDTIDFGGQLSDFDRGVPVYDVDVGISFDDQANTGLRWGWQDQKNTGAGPASTGASGKFAYPTSPLTTIDDGGVGLPAPTPPDAIGAPGFDTRNPGVPGFIGDPSDGGPAPPGAQGSSIGMSQFLQQAYGQAGQSAQKSPYDLSMGEYLRKLAEARNQRIGQVG